MASLCQYIFIYRAKNSSSHRPHVLNMKSCRLRWDLPKAKGHGTMITNFPLYFLIRNVLLREILLLSKSAACDLQRSFPALDPSKSKVGLLLLIINQKKSWSIPSVYQSTVFLNFREQTSELTRFFMRGNIFFLFCFQLLPGTSDQSRRHNDTIFLRRLSHR